MYQRNVQTRSNFTSGRSAAHNSSSAGIALPAVNSPQTQYSKNTGGRNQAQSKVVQMQREWVGFDANRYREEGGRFYRLNTNTGDWDEINITSSPVLLTEAVSQYFGGIVREEAPPASLGRSIGFHITPIPVGRQQLIPVFQGIVGQWDTSLARTGHALGSGAPKDRKNQYGDGIYAAKGEDGQTDYQHPELPSLVYEVYVMRGINFQGQQDGQQIVLSNPQQFIYVCFVLRRILPSLRSVVEEKQSAKRFDPPPPPPTGGAGGFDNRDSSGKLHYSVF